MGRNYEQPSISHNFTLGDNIMKLEISNNDRIAAKQLELAVLNSAKALGLNIRLRFQSLEDPSNPPNPYPDNRFLDIQGSSSGLPTVRARVQIYNSVTSAIIEDQEISAQIPFGEITDGVADDLLIQVYDYVIARIETL